MNKCQIIKYFFSLFDITVIVGGSHRRCSIKKVFWKISQNSQENTCATVSFLIKLQASACNFIKKETLAQAFSCVFCKIFNNIFLIQHLRVTASALFTAIRILGLNINYINPLRASPTKWSNTLKQFVANLTTNRLSVFDHFAELALKMLILKCLMSTKKFINNWTNMQLSTADLF